MSLVILIFSVLSNIKQSVFDHFHLQAEKNPGKNPSQNELSGENPSGENPSKVSCGENPSPYFGACGENPSCYFQACGENPSTL